MLSRAGFKLALLIALAAASLYSPTFVNAASPQAMDLYRKVSLFYGASRKAIRTLQCHYTFHCQDLLYDCRYAFDGDKFYYGGVIKGMKNESLSMPRECAWDGQIAYVRPGMELFSHSMDRQKADKGCMTPEEVLDIYIAAALGLKSDPLHQQYTLLDGNESEFQGEPCIDLKFTMTGQKAGSLSVRFGKEHGYWPVWELVANPDGTPRSELTSVVYTKLNTDGNDVFYPIQMAHTLTFDQNRKNLASYQVDPKTLKINQPIDPSRFALTPWPCQEVYDWDTNKSTRPVDPAWDPVGKVDFPFDDFVRWAEVANKVSEQYRQQSSQLSQSARNLTGLAVLPQSGAVRERSRTWIMLLALGIAMVLVGIIWNLKYRIAK